MPISPSSAVTMLGAATGLLFSYYQIRTQPSAELNTPEITETSDPLIALAKQIQLELKASKYLAERCAAIIDSAHFTPEKQRIANQTCQQLQDILSVRSHKHNSIFNELAAKKLIDLDDYSIVLADSLKLMSLKLYDNSKITADGQELLACIITGDDHKLADFFLTKYQAAQTKKKKKAKA